MCAWTMTSVHCPKVQEWPTAQVAYIATAGRVTLLFRAGGHWTSTTPSRGLSFAGRYMQLEAEVVFSVCLLSSSLLLDSQLIFSASQIPVDRSHPLALHVTFHSSDRADWFPTMDTPSDVWDGQWLYMAVISLFSPTCTDDSSVFETVVWGKQGHGTAGVHKSPARGRPGGYILYSSP